MPIFSFRICTSKSSRNDKIILNDIFIFNRVPTYRKKIKFMMKEKNLNKRKLNIYNIKLLNNYNVICKGIQRGQNSRKQQGEAVFLWISVNYVLLIQL
jgi:hypothetical protein